MRRIAALLAVLCAGVPSAVAQQAPPSAPVTEMGSMSPGPIFAAPPGAPSCELPGGMPSHGAQTHGGVFSAPGPTGPWETGPPQRPWLLRQCDLRHSSTHGRAMGPGQPLRGTSWLNRPLSISLDGGALLMGDRPAPNVRASNDLLAAIGVGYDWDHYWGTQVRVAWSTPELLNTTQTAASSSDNLFITDLSLLYYPWGDSRVRPYWRFGVGLTDVEYTNDLGRRNQDMLLTIPLGVGLKRQFSRKCACRLELMDNVAFGQGETGTLNNFSITLGVEWRLGGRPDSGWGWAPRGGGW